MSGIQLALLWQTPQLAPLSGTMTASGTSGNLKGFSTGLSIGTLSVTAFPPPPYAISELSDNTGTNRFRLQVSDPDGLLTLSSFTSITMNALTFRTDTGIVFSQFGSTQAIWEWSNSGVLVTGSGRTFVIA